MWQIRCAMNILQVSYSSSSGAAPVAAPMASPGASQGAGQPKVLTRYSTALVCPRRWIHFVKSPRGSATVYKIPVLPCDFARSSLTVLACSMLMTTPEEVGWWAAWQHGRWMHTHLEIRQVQSIFRSSSSTHVRPPCHAWRALKAWKTCHPHPRLRRLVLERISAMTGANGSVEKSKCDDIHVYSSLALAMARFAGDAGACSGFMKK